MLGTQALSAKRRSPATGFESPAKGPGRVPRIYLDALRDLGMSDEQIGRYFDIPQSEVEASLGNRPM